MSKLQNVQAADTTQVNGATTPAANTNDTWVRPYFNKYRKHLGQALALGVLTFICAAMLMFVSGYLISRCAERPEGGVFVVLVPVAFVQIFGMGKPIVRYIERLVSHDWVFRMTSDLRLRLYTALERSAMSLRRSRQTGDFLGLVAEDIGHLQNLYLRTIFPVVIGWVLFALVSIFWGIFDLPFGLAMFVLLALVVFALPLVSLLVNRQRIEREKALKNELYTDLTDNVLGATDWVFSGRADEYLAHAKGADTALHAQQSALARYYRINDLVAMAVLTVAAVVIFIWSANYFGGQGLPRANWIAAFVLGFFPLIEAFMPLTSAVTQVNVYRDSTKRLNEYPTIHDDDLGVDPETFNTATAVRFAIDDLMNQSNSIVKTEEVSDNASATCHCAVQNSAQQDSSCAPLLHASKKIASQSNENSIQTVASASSDTTSSTSNDKSLNGISSDPSDTEANAAITISVQNVSFAYEGGRLVLDGITLDIPAGQKVAVLGRSGSGKSTLAQLMRGDLTPTNGTITLDDENVADLGEGIPTKLGVVQQSAYLFNRTLRENLQIGREDATDEEIWAALNAVELGTMAHALPKGLDTMVDEAGMRFSGGERHRIALARVLLARVGAILLDEPTVGLDPITESALLDTLFKVAADKTLVMITHHLQDIERFDRVVFIEDGHIELDGSPTELAKTSERFRTLRNFDFGLAV